MTKLMLRDFKNESLFFKINSCFFLAKRKIVEFVITCDAKKIVRINVNRDAKKIIQVMKITRITNDFRRTKTSFFFDRFDFFDDEIFDCEIIIHC